MSAKRGKKDKGPSWLEVGLGAVLSIILGVALGVVFLVLKPVSKVTAIPKDAPAGAVYYIEGARDFNKTTEVDEIRKSFLAGGSVSITEGELNVILGDATSPPAPAADAAAPAAAKPPPGPQKLFAPGPLNARIHDGKIQFADTATISALGVDVSVIVQATGTFSKHGSTFAFDPESFYVGGCPMQRLLFVKDWALAKLLFAQPVPDDLAAAWSKLVDVSVDSTGLQLKGPQG
jgi:hypothetical protein